MTEVAEVEVTKAAEPEKQVAAPAKTETKAVQAEAKAPAPETKKAEAKAIEPPVTLLSEAESPDVELTSPEGENVDPEVLGEFSRAVSELKIDAKNAQQLLNRVVPVMRERNIEFWRGEVAKWGEETRADPDFGGRNLKANVAQALTFARKLDPSGEFLNTLNRLGLGNDLRVLRALKRGAELIGGETIAVGAGKVEPAKRTYAEELRERYPEIYAGR